MSESHIYYDVNERPIIGHDASCHITLTLLHVYMFKNQIDQAFTFVFHYHGLSRCSVEQAAFCAIIPLSAVMRFMPFFGRLATNFGYL